MTTMVCAQMATPSMESDNPFLRKKTSPTPSGANNTTAAKKLVGKDKELSLNAASSSAWE